MGYEKVALECNRLAKIKEGDYQKDGLWYCHVCNKPMQAVIPPFGIVTVRCDCEVKEDEEKKKAEREFKIAEQIERRKKKCFYDTGCKDGINRKALKARFETDWNPNCEASKIARAYCENWYTMRDSNIGLKFVGVFGAGKSFYASCIANELIEKHRVKVLFRTVNQLILDLEDWDKKEDVIEDIRTCGLLILDDVGSQRDTSYGADRLYTIINARYEVEKPLIVTTNLTGKDIDSSDKDLMRSFERITEMCPRAIVLKNEGTRRGIATQKRKIIDDLLGV